MKIYSFYLPQFHPIPENDFWWGKGFTEWRNVTLSTPLFKGHRQPQIPADLGFYDLRCQEIRYEQAKLAREYGVDGFIYYHYWFEGKRLLEKPLNDVVSDKNYDFPFAVCWANETWSRAWDGLDHEVLIAQTYSLEDHERHAEYLISLFKDERYIKVNNRPLFLIYRIAKVEFLDEFLSILKKKSLEAGIMPPYVSAVRSSFKKELSTFDFSIVDAVVDFQPNAEDFPKSKGIQNKIINILKNYLPDSFYQRLKLNVKARKVISYADYVNMKISHPLKISNSRVFPCCFPSWDNSPRRKTPTIIQNDDPELFKKWIVSAKKQVSSYPDEEQIIFINAWNEWAEGCHLEPDLVMGYKFLEAVRDARRS